MEFAKFVTKEKTNRLDWEFSKIYNHNENENSNLQKIRVKLIDFLYFFIAQNSIDSAW